MSDTLRTDARETQERSITTNGWDYGSAMAWHGRQLERELAAMTAERDALHNEIAAWKKWASSSRCIYCDAEFLHDPINQEAADELKKAHILVCPKHPYHDVVELLREFYDKTCRYYYAERGGLTDRINAVLQPNRSTTAPQSCWIGWNDESEEAEFFHTAPTGGPNDVQYLRSDLTCAGCGHMEQDTEDASIWECDWFGEKRDPLRPACMMFSSLLPSNIPVERP